MILRKSKYWIVMKRLFLMQKNCNPLYYTQRKIYSFLFALFVESRIKKHKHAILRNIKWLISDAEIDLSSITSQAASMSMIINPHWLALLSISKVVIICLFGVHKTAISQTSVFEDESHPEGRTAGDMTVANFIASRFLCKAKFCSS